MLLRQLQTLRYFRKKKNKTQIFPCGRGFSGCRLRGNPTHSKLRGRAVVSAPVWHWSAAGKPLVLGRARRGPARPPAIPPPIPLSPVFPCGPGSREWEYFDGKCYYFSLTRTSWYKARADCEEMHSQLVIINSYAEQVKTPAPGGNPPSSPESCPAPRFFPSPHSAHPNLAGQPRAGAVILCISQQRAGRTCSARPLPASRASHLGARGAQTQHRHPSCSSAP